MDLSNPGTYLLITSLFYYGYYISKTNKVMDIMNIIDDVRRDMGIDNIHVSFGYRRRNNKQCSGYANIAKRHIHIKIPRGILCAMNFIYVVRHELTHIKLGKRPYNGLSHNYKQGMPSVYSCKKMFGCNNTCYSLGNPFLANI